jgi:hypothetical protein
MTQTIYMGRFGVAMVTGYEPAPGVDRTAVSRSILILSERKEGFRMMHTPDKGFLMRALEDGAMVIEVTNPESALLEVFRCTTTNVLTPLDEAEYLHYRAAYTKQLEEFSDIAKEIIEDEQKKANKSE